MPERIQRKRKKGWRMPKNTVNICRPSKFGNPFTISGAIEAGYGEKPEDVAQMCVDVFRDWLERGNKNPDYRHLPELEKQRKAIFHNLEELRGKNLACYCKEGQPCHGDVLLELANRQGAKC